MGQNGSQGVLRIMTNEAFSRVKIDAQLRDQGCEITNTNAVRFEYVLPDRTKADYVLCDRKGRFRRSARVVRRPRPKGACMNLDHQPLMLPVLPCALASETCTDIGQ